jgi:hypothetical protein
MEAPLRFVILTQSKQHKFKNMKRAKIYVSFPVGLLNVAFSITYITVEEEDG